MDKKKITFWLPRGLTILYALFLALFSLDVFTGDLSLAQKIIGFFAHNIPSFSLIIILLATWKKSLTASILLFVTLVVFTVVFGLYKHIMSFLVVAGPLMFSAILYLYDHLSTQESAPRERGLLEEDDDLDEIIKNS